MGHVLSRKSASYRQPADHQENPSVSKTSSKGRRSQCCPSTTVMEEQTSGQEGNEAVISSLSERGRDVIRTTWCNDFGILYDLGADIYNEIFRLDPNVKYQFKELDEYELGKDLRQVPAFKKQALRFVQTISMAVQNCAHLHTINEYLKDIGRRHVQFKQTGFQPSHWTVFETAITNVMKERAGKNNELNEEEKTLLADSYQLLARHIIAVMTDGFTEEENRWSIDHQINPQ